MNKIACLSALMLILASTCGAVGLDLSVNACPGGGGAQSGEIGTLDCAGGSTVVILGTFAPNEGIADLVALDSVLELKVTPDLDASGFWDFVSTGCGGQNQSLSMSQSRPAGVCNAYTATWVTAGSAAGIGAARISSSIEKIAVVCSRGGLLAVTANQKLFGFQLIIDTAQAAEAGGICSGCAAPVCLAWVSGQPESASGAAVTELTGPNLLGNVISMNGGGALCGALVKTTPTWNQLKSIMK